LTEEQKQTIAAMRRQGVACTDIAAAVGATPTAVRTHCHRYRAEIEAPRARQTQRLLLQLRRADRAGTQAQTA